MKIIPKDTKGVIRSRKPKMDSQNRRTGQFNGQMKKDKQRLAMQYVKKLDIEQYEPH